MRTFPALYQAEINKTVGALPVWILKLTVSGTDYYISSREILCSEWGATTLPRVKSWGQIQEGITGNLGEFSVSEFSVEFVIDPSSSPNIETLIMGDIEENPAELYLKFEGSASTAQLMFSGYVRDASFPTETTARVSLQDASVRLEKFYPGRRMTLADYPSAATADVGKVIPIVCGSVEKIPMLAVDSGWITTLSADCTDSATTLYVSELPADSVVGLTVYVDTEQVLISSANTSAKTIVVTRGYSGTTAVDHLSSALVVEKKATPLVFMAGDTAVTSMGTVFARVGNIDVDITSDCTRYTGATGNQLTGYEGKAVVSISTAPTIIKSIQMAIANSLTVSQGNHNHPASAAYTTITFDTVTIEFSSGFEPGHNQTYLNDGDDNTYTQADGAGAFVSYRHNAVISNSATPISIRMVLIYSNTSDGFSAGEAYVILNGTTVETWNLGTATLAKGTRYSGWHTISSWADVYAATTKAYFHMHSSAKFYEAYWEIQTGTASTYSSAAGVALTGDLSLIGGNTANVVAFDSLLCTATNGNISGPESLCNWILGHAGMGSITVSGTVSAPGFGGLINEYKPAIWWLNYIAWQCRSYFKFELGAPRLIVRPDSIRPSDTLSACAIDDSGRMRLSRQKKDTSNILNMINLLYQRDWSKSRSAENYHALLTVSDSASITKYGESEKPDLFQLDFVTSAEHAASLCAFYLNRYKGRPWRYTFTQYIQRLALEFADAVTLSFSGNFVGEIVEKRLSPGDYNNLNAIDFVVEG